MVGTFPEAYSPPWHRTDTRKLSLEGTKEHLSRDVRGEGQEIRERRGYGRRREKGLGKEVRERHVLVKRPRGTCSGETRGEAKCLG